MSAYEVWAGWVGRGLCMELQAALHSDAALTSSTPLQAWEETIIAQVLAPKTPLLHPRLSIVWPSHLLLKRLCSVIALVCEPISAQQIVVECCDHRTTELLPVWFTA